MTEDGLILPKYFRAMQYKITALGMVNTRSRGIKDECNEKLRNILSQ
jgi:hypothetical protein